MRYKDRLEEDDGDWGELDLMKNTLFFFFFLFFFPPIRF